ncbi:hypothetical protein B0H13DRAFT_2383867 [Mycena leptocephala]|nr:hypothetical protein B0H13DRAFT_2383867 [Mycena leptocephala]
MQLGVCAAPLNPLFGRATCDVKNCVVALAPSFPTACDPAAAQLGANTLFNTACLAAAVKGTAAFPTSCAPCAAQFGVTDPGNKAPGTTNGGATANAPNTNGPNTNAPTAQGANTNGASRNGTPANGAAANTRLAPRANGKKAPPAPPAPAPVPPAPAPPAPVPAAPEKGKAAARANKAAPALAAHAPAPAAPARAPPAPAPPSPKKAKNGKAPAPAHPRASVCDIPACVITLEPSFPSCAPAVTQLGANTSFNGNCLVAAAKGTAPFPTACGGCAAQFGVTEPDSTTNTNTNTQSPAPVGVRVSIKHLFLDESVFALEAEAVQRVLSSCTRVVNVFASCTTSTQALDPLAQFQWLRRLAIDVHDFLSVCAIDGKAFLNTLTHLLLLNTTTYFQYTGDPDVSALTAHIGSLKHLTHVAFDSELPSNALYAKLCSRARIQCIVCLNLEEYEIEAVAPLAEEDDCFVCIEQNIPFRKDRLQGTNGGRDFWALAEAFVAARRAGKVDSDEYSIVDDDDSWNI